METTTFTDQSSRLASANPGGASVLAAPAGSLILALPAAAPEFILTGQVRPGEPLAAAWGRLADELAVRQAELLGLMIYAPVALQPQIKRVMRVILGKTDWPVTWVDADDCEGRPLPGMQAFAVSGRPVSRVRLGDMVVGSVYDDGAARFCLLGGLGPADASVTAPAQARQTFDRLAAALESAGFALGDVVRTWFYNERILDWYGDFNLVRTSCYDGVKFRTGSLPASTGIGTRQSGGAALTVAAWAMQPLTGAAHAREIASPLQCPAPVYGSSFSRAMEMESAGWLRLLVSGTASIHPDGRTAWVGDPRRQIDLSMDVVAAILDSRGMTWRDVTRATAYFQRPRFRSHFEEWTHDHGWDDLPVVSLLCEICRHDLLFEIEVDARIRS